MADTIFLLGDGNELLEMIEQPYEAEDVLQELLASHPRLLSGDRGSGSEHDWLLVSREASLPSEPEGAGRWSLDHLFLDPEGVPTLVEVKRSSDTRIRREVVGQMLDYAANAVVYWPIETLRTAFIDTCREEAVDPDARLATFLAGGDPEEFWMLAKTNLQAGRVRLVFVSDEIPSELRRIVEFLNEQMDPAEVLAIEVRQFVGEGHRTLVPRLVGKTADAERRKGAATREQRQWDEESFIEELTRGSPADVPVVQAVVEWARENGLQMWWGKGKQTGSLIPILEFGEEWYSFVGFWTNGRGQVQFGMMQRREPFKDIASRREFARRLSEVPGIALEEDTLDRYPSFELSALRDDDSLSKFIAALDWALAHVTRDAADPGL